MKDLEIRNALQRSPSPLVKLGLYVNGRWQFGSLAETSFITDNGQNIYRVAVRFSLIPQNVNDPSFGSVVGKPGDYVGIDRTGTLSLITKEQYSYRFPKKRKPAYTADTSEKLKDKNYITEIVRGSAPATSNTTPRTTYTPSTGGSSTRTSGGSSGGGGGGY